MEGRKQDQHQAFPFPPPNRLLARHSGSFEGGEADQERQGLGVQVSQAEQSLLRGRLSHEEVIMHQRQSSKLMFSQTQAPPVSPDAHSLSPSYISTQALPTLSPTLDHHSDVGQTSLFPVLESVTSLPGLQMSDHLEQGESSGGDTVSDKAGMTWLDAAQQVLEEAGHPLHIKEIKKKIMEKGYVQSSSNASLEAVLYRETQKGSRRFQRIDGRFGVFALLPKQDQLYMAPPRVKSEPSLKRKHISNMEDRASQNERYKQKYKKLRKIVKSMVFENAALCDEAARTQDKLLKTKEERKFLLKRLFQYQTLSDVASLSAPQHAGITAQQPSMFGGLGEAGQALNLNPQAAGSSSSKHSKESKSGEKKDKNKQKKEKGGDVAVKNKSRTKRKKQTDIKKLVTTIPLDPTGKPIFPIVLGGLTVHSLGDIQAKPNFHDEDYIYPIGFCSTRVYASFKNPNQKCLYTCKVLDGGTRPKFEIDPEDCPDRPIKCSTATECHKRLVNAINLAVCKELISSEEDSGPEFFGFSHPTIQNLIQSCPGARKCTEYKWKKFEPCKPTERDEIIASRGENDPSISFEAFLRAKNADAERERELYLQHKISALEGSTSSLRSLLTTGMPGNLTAVNQQAQMSSPQSLLAPPQRSLLSPTSLMTSPEMETPQVLLTSPPSHTQPVLKTE
ncbi:uncharacterized protein [Ptychodera flava]|uniref:uncharacterized protein n=1 Tax=Ptychodera flava TaxID=63121 RepID=UPI003969E2A6